MASKFTELAIDCADPVALARFWCAVLDYEVSALTTDHPGARFLPNHRGRTRYLGPRPLPGHGAHRYRFHLYALDTAVDFAQVGGGEHLPSALAGHVLASGTLTGTRTT
jgi:hypothetical protein